MFQHAAIQANNLSSIDWLLLSEPVLGTIAGVYLLCGYLIKHVVSATNQWLYNDKAYSLFKNYRLLVADPIFWGVALMMIIIIIIVIRPKPRPKIPEWEILFKPGLEHRYFTV